MIRTSLIAAATLALSAFAVAAEPVKITFWHAMGGRLGEVVDDITAKFNASQSDYLLESIYKGNYEETLTATIAAFRAGEQPNIVQVFDAGAATIIGAKGAVIAAEDLMKDNGIAFDRDDYISGVRYFYADTSGKMVGMPFNSSTPIMYYNVAALEKAGVTPPKTWEEFQSTTAPALKEAGMIPLAQSHLPWIFTENFMSRHNLQFASNNNGYEGTDGTKILVNNDAIKAHFSALVDWSKDGYFKWYGAGWGDNQSAFENQEVAMWLGSSGSFGGLTQSAKFEFSATYLPYWEAVTSEPTNTFIGGAALFAMSGKADDENKGSAEFFKFLTSPAVQFLWHRDTGYVPITNEAYEMAKILDYYTEVPAAEVGIQQLTLPGGDWTKGYRMGFYVQIRDVMNREYGRILTGETDVETGFGIIETESNKLLERFAKTSN